MPEYDLEGATLGPPDKEALRLEVERLRLQAIGGVDQVVEALMPLRSISEDLAPLGLPALNPRFLEAAPYQIASALQGQLLAATWESMEIWLPGDPPIVES